MVEDIPSDVRDQFLELSRMLHSRGFRKHSADAILHRIRWLGSVEHGDRDYKCNNNWTSALARWAMETDPSLDGLFETRNRKAEKAA